MRVRFRQVGPRAVHWAHPRMPHSYAGNRSMGAATQSSRELKEPVVAVAAEIDGKGR